MCRHIICCVFIVVQISSRSTLFNPTSCTSNGIVLNANSNPQLRPVSKKNVSDVSLFFFSHILSLRLRGAGKAARNRKHSTRSSVRICANLFSVLPTADILPETATSARWCRRISSNAGKVGLRVINNKYNRYSPAIRISTSHLTHYSISGRVCCALSETLD